MSEKILHALMRLFAIIAKVDIVNEENESVKIDSVEGKNTIRILLESELSSDDVKKYLDYFESELNQIQGKLFRKKGSEKRVSSNSVKVLRICKELNQELTHEQKIIVVLGLLEFINNENRQFEQELDFIETVSQEFQIEKEEYDRIRQLIINDYDENSFVLDEYNLYYIHDAIKVREQNLIVHKGLDNPIRIIWLPSANIYFFKYFGREQLFQNGREILNKSNIFFPGSWITTAKIKKIYFTDVVTKMARTISPENLELSVENVSYSFSDSNIGIQPLSFSSNESNFIAIMGGSGAGKSTLLKLISGEFTPTTGSVVVNGLDVTEFKAELSVLFGVVSQEDQLIEELTVYANLMYAGMLTLGHLTKQQIKDRVYQVMKDLGLYEIRKLKVGTKSQKIISGGQRKRLNIGLELLRRPKILLVDEPTSGLSSRDSEIIIDILKESCLKGTLVISVIHQPSSDIFKLFDRLLILDKGGYLIFDGIPLNAPVHFKTHSFQGNPDEQECRVCGNVNPEQIFSLIDRKVVDEVGRPTKTRRIEPKKWNEIHEEHRHNFDVQEVISPPETNGYVPNVIKQFGLYFTRDGNTKLANIQYVLTNFLIAPILAIILSFCLKFFGEGKGAEYSYNSNENIPIYLFMATIVAVFLGLNTAAEEIIREKALASREKRMQLSRLSYLLAKAAMLFSISAFQIFLFIIVGNYLLEVKGQTFSFWLILASTACAFNVLGLLVSSAFNSAKVIYIAIPILIIPQLIFSGVIVPFDRLHPNVASKVKVPWVGNIHVSRWTYEGLITNQAITNDYNKEFFELDVETSHLRWKRDFWIPEMRKLISKMENKKLSPLESKNVILGLQEEDDRFNTIVCSVNWSEASEKGYLSLEDINNVRIFLEQLRYYYSQRYISVKDDVNSKNTKIGKEQIQYLLNNYSNPEIDYIVTEKFNDVKFIIQDGTVIRTADPIYNPSKEKNFFHAQMYSPSKIFFGQRLSTYAVNTIVIWTFALLCFIALYIDIVNVVMNWIRGKKRKSNATNE